MRKGLIAFLALMAATFLAGCTTVRGGGWMQSANGSGRATFGFQLVCDPEDGSVSGQLQYHDRGLGVRFHATAEATPNPCSPGATGEFTGSYRPQPLNAGQGGSFQVQVVDGGEPGPSTGDSFAVWLTGGLYDGYANSGTLQGGNIQTFK